MYTSGRAALIGMLLALAATAAHAQTETEVQRLERAIGEARQELDALKTVQREGQGQDSPLNTRLKNNVFSWQTEDGRFAFIMGSWVQFRLTYNDERAQDSEGAGDPNRATASNGRDFANFSITRFKTFFRGNIFEKEFKYFALIHWTVPAGEIAEEAYFTWAKYKFFNVSAGQTKIPFSYDFLCGYNKQQLTEGSVANETYHQGWGKGLWVSGVIGDDRPWLKYTVGIFNGVLKANNDFRNMDRAAISQSFSQSVDADLMPALRLETHPLGEVADDLIDLRGADTYDKLLFSVGFAMNWLISRFDNNAIRPRPVASTGGSGRFNSGQDTIALTLDGHLRWHGLSVNIAWYHRHTEFHNFGLLAGNGVARNRNAPGDLTDNAITFEAGYFILPKQFDVAVRIGMIDSDEFWLAGASTRQFALRPDSKEIGIGAGYYFAGHNLKVQFDFDYVAYQLARTAGAAPSNAPANQPMPNRSASSLANDVSDYWNVWQLRLQLQWMF
ncbi:MAG: hypothetical protein IT462_00805 [Planctomycetes bacterium]|nr:hypothetical protein [Planctomycetota bacterium]